MRLPAAKRNYSLRKALASTQGSARTILLVLIAFGLGVGLTAVWLHHPKPAASAAPAAENATVNLSDTTRSVLARLNAPVQVHFYAVLDPASVPDTTRAFAQRASQLLGAYEQEAGGKLKVTRYDTLSPANQNAAAKDGIQPFNLDKGEACYLGVALFAQGQKETLPHLSPEWEGALEADLTRAMARLNEAITPGAAPGAISQVNTQAEKEVQALIPNLSAVTVEQGTKLIREAALKAFQQTAAETAAQVQQAQQQLAEAQNGKSAADQQAAMQHLQQVQAEQAAKLKEITAKSQAEIEALQRLKARQ